jgi:hypothetical protein
MPTRFVLPLRVPARPRSHAVELDAERRTMMPARSKGAAGIIGHR